MSVILKNLSDDAILNTVKMCGSVRKAAKDIGVPRRTLRARLEKIGFRANRTSKPISERFIKPPRKGKPAKVFILTSAQSDTEADRDFVRSLERYAKHRNAEIVVAPFIYNCPNAVDCTFDHVIEKYLMSSRINFNNQLVFCGEMNTSPTAVLPLSGLETYTRDKSGIFPHPKVQLKSIPTHKLSPAKIIATTGSITKTNYIQKKAGIKAEFHHIVGAVVVELDCDGDVFFRHIQPNENGAFRDLDTLVTPDGVVTSCKYVTAITYGDIHYEQADHKALDIAFFAEDSLTKVLNPKHRFIHDIIDFTERNSHNTGDHHFRFSRHAAGNETVKNSIMSAAAFLHEAQRHSSSLYVVNSNHDDQLERWLRIGDYRTDPVNAEFFLEAQLEMYRSIRRQDTDFSILEWAMRAGDLTLPEVEFLRQDESKMVEGIEYGMHGHLGANGSRATPAQYTKMGPKTCTAHTHSAFIQDGSYVAGTLSKLDLGYNSGLSSWSQSCIVTYPGNARAIITFKNGKWRAK